MTKPTLKSWYIISSSMLSHYTDTIRRRLSHFSLLITDITHEVCHKKLLVVERRLSRMLQQIVKYTQTPLSVCPGSLLTLQ